MSNPNGVASSVLVVNVPRYIEGKLWRHPAVVNETLELKVSPLVGPTDEFYQPVYEFLHSVCAKETHWETQYHPYWKFGRASVTQYTIYAECPGKATDHLCKEARQERGVEWQRTDL